MLMYHGSYTKIIHPDIEYSRNNLDFGKGFYLTKDHDQAEKWALRFMKQKLDCVVNVYDVNLDYLEKNSQMKIFDSYNEEWLHFVISHRQGKTIEGFDVISGGIANDKVFNTIELFLNGLIHETEALGRLQYQQPNWQMCIRNQNILNTAVQFCGSEVIKYGSE